MIVGIKTRGTEGKNKQPKKEDKKSRKEQKIRSFDEDKSLMRLAVVERRVVNSVKINSSQTHKLKHLEEDWDVFLFFFSFRV